MIRLSVSTSVDDDVVNRIEAGLDEYNFARSGPDNYQALWIVARAGDDALAGGLKGYTADGWMFVDWLWVREEDRKSGLGSRLMREAEEIARQRGCLGAYLETFSYQAPEFYKRLGYEEFGRIDDYPPGHATIWLKKRF